MENCICGRYKLERLIDTGSFSEIYQVSHKETNEKYAVKIEKLSSPFNLLQAESRILRILEGIEGIPKVYNIGKDSENYYMVMQLLGSSLNDYFYTNGPLELRILSTITSSLLRTFKEIHKSGYVHRDIKPENFLFGLNSEQSQIFVIDFGLSFKYLKGEKHRKMKTGQKLVGTARFVSVNTHLGLRQARRDDLESLAYMFIWLGKGKLPWMHIRSASCDRQFDGILEIKRNLDCKQVCDGLPSVFEEFLQSCKNLEYEETLDYDEFIRKFEMLV